jgi:hypothetical protein
MEVLSFTLQLSLLKGKSLGILWRVYLVSSEAGLSLPEVETTSAHPVTVY